MSDSPLIQLAETIQTASIKRHPSPRHDLNPSTSASQKQPVTIDSAAAREAVDDHIPIETHRPVPRSTRLPPLPDLRFEQSYLQSIQSAQDWRGVAFITLRDQLFMPLLQGTLWTLAVCGWRYWNRTAALSGQTIGARIRRWWWAVNDWTLPSRPDEQFAEQIKETMLTALKYYAVEFAAGGD